MFQDILYVASRSEEQWRWSHTCGAGVPPKTGSFVLFRLVHTSAHTVLLWSLHLPTILAYRLFFCTINIERACQSSRKIPYAHALRVEIRFSSALCKMRCVAATAKSSRLKSACMDVTKSIYNTSRENFYTIQKRFFYLFLPFSDSTAINRIVAMLSIIISLWKISAVKIL